MLRRFSIRTRNALLTALNLVIVLSIAGFLGARALQESTDRLLAERLRLAQIAALHIDNHVVKDVLNLLERAAASQGFDLTGTGTQPERRALHELYNTGLFTYDVFITDKQGIVLMTEPDLPQVVGADLSLHPHITAALATGQAQVSGLLTTPSGQPLVSFVVPVTDRGGAVAGLIGGAADPGSPSLAGIVGTLRPLEAGHVDLVDQGCLVLASTDPDHVTKASHHCQSFLPLLQSRQAAVETYSVIEAGVEQRRDVIALAPLSAAPWMVSIEQPEAEALALVHALRQQMISIGVVILLIALVATWITTQALVIPIRQLLGDARRIASGDLDTPVPIGGHDEITALSHGFETMRQKLAAWGDELETAVQQRTRELSTLYAIDRAAAHSLELDEILSAALDKTMEVLEVEAGSIFLLEPDGETMTLHIHRGVSDEFVKAIRQMRVGEGVSGRAVAEGKPFALDVLDFPAERLAPFVLKEGYRNLVSTPLVSKGTALGALTLGTHRPRAFLPEEMKLLASIGQQLGGTVENAQLYAGATESLARERRLNEVAHTISAVLDSEAILARVMQLAAELVGAEAGAMAIIEPGAQIITYPHFFNLPAELSLEPTLKGEGVAWQIVQTGQPVLLADYAAHPDALPHWVAAGMHSFAGVPLTVGETTVGALGLFRFQEGAQFHERDLALASAVARQAAVAVQNARLFEAGQKQLQLAQTLQQVGALLTARLSLEEVFEALFDLLARVIQYDVVSIQLLTERGVLDLTASRGFPDVAEAEELVHRISAQTLSQRWADPQAMVITDTRTDPRWIHAPENDYVHSWIGAPLLVKGWLIGVLNVDSKIAGAYDAALGETTMAFANQAAVAIENARLFDETERRARQLSLVGEIAHHAVAQLDPDALLWETARAIQTTFGFSDVLIFTVDHQHQQIIRKAWAGRHERRDVTADLPKQIEERGILDWVATHGETVLANDVRRDARYAPLYTQTAAELCVPLKDNGVVTGGINVESEEPDAFDQSHVLAMEALADNLVVALRNARLYQEAQQRLVELSALFEVSGDLRGAETVGAMLPIILDKTVGVLGVDTGVLFCWDESTQELIAEAALGRLEGLLGLRLGPTEGVCGYVAQTSTPYLFTELASDPHTGEQLQPLVKGIQGGICTPLMTGEQLVGALIVGSDTPRTFTDDEIHLLTAIADMAASAIRRAGLHEQLEESYVQTVLALAKAMDARDAYTSDHSQRLAVWAGAVARELGCDRKEIEIVQWGALLHDIGKLAVPDAILRKPGPLTDEEWAIMKRHPETGAEIVLPVKRLADVAPVIRAHQEKYNGSGYPDGLREKEIPLGARILAVVDAYGAITDERVYRKARSRAEAVAELRRCAGTHFDPKVVEVFLTVISESVNQ